MFLSEWRELPSAPCLEGKKNLMTARVSMLLKLRASLTCFRACFRPGWAKDLSAPQYICVFWDVSLCGWVNSSPCFKGYIYIFTQIYKWFLERLSVQCGCCVMLQKLYRVWLFIHSHQQFCGTLCP